MKNKLQEFLSSFNPAKREQDKYKKRAKEKGMLSFEEFMSLQDSIKESPQEFLDLSKDLKVTLSLQTNNFTAEEKSQLKRDNGVVTLKNKLVFNSNNLNGFAINPQSLLDNKHTQEIGEVNVDHNQNLTAVIGEFYNYKADGDMLYADIDVDTNHPEFASQLYLIETQDLTLGWSIEARLTGMNGFYDFMTGEGDLVWDYALTGLGATFTPAVPTTLMMEEDKSELLSTADTTKNKIQLSMTEEQITQLQADLATQTSLATSLEAEKITLSATITALEAEKVELSTKVTEAETKLAQSEELAKLSNETIKALDEANTALSKKLNTPQTIF